MRLGQTGHVLLLGAVGIYSISAAEIEDQYFSCSDFGVLDFGVLSNEKHHFTLPWVSKQNDSKQILR